MQLFLLKLPLTLLRQNRKNNPFIARSVFYEVYFFDVICRGTPQRAQENQIKMPAYF